MKTADVIRAWRDEEYRSSLGPEEQALLPPNPADAIELEEVELSQVAGAAVSFWKADCGPLVDPLYSWLLPCPY